ncbi:DnaJ family domain-containing protein [Actinomarinicola tropica]|uniref:DUF1992 domain-containing protein n=1 Tax=Actinomarinicola tropica TaxID=2789776 RepID=A0A5Q2RIT2_9ACTN|nr:DUF1992 domain-containing protein [Actinomarinicola tropica]QGG94296.1 DUF1992 domain-containing protein [Actinomarinicola tropica]
MTERKPPGMTWETWIDRQIREAQDRGEFDGLALEGRPIPGLDRPRDPDWWHKSLLRREGVQQLPTTLRVRKELEDSLAAIAASEDELEVREIITAINRRIRDVNRLASSGPPSNLVPLDEERVVRTWAEGRAS